MKPLANLLDKKPPIDPPFVPLAAALSLDNLVQMNFLNYKMYCFSEFV